MVALKPKKKYTHTQDPFSFFIFQYDSRRDFVWCLRVSEIDGDPTIHSQLLHISICTFFASSPIISTLSLRHNFSANLGLLSPTHFCIIYMQAYFADPVSPAVDNANRLFEKGHDGDTQISSMKYVPIRPFCEIFCWLAVRNYLGRTLLYNWLRGMQRGSFPLRIVL